MTFHVILADDQSEVRSALRLLLEQEPGFSVVGEAATLADLCTQLRAGECDLVLLDWELPGRSDSQLIPLLQASNLHLRVIALSLCPDSWTRKSAQAAGVYAFVSKSDSPDILLSILRSLAS